MAGGDQGETRSELLIGGNSCDVTHSSSM